MKKAIILLPFVFVCAVSCAKLDTIGHYSVRAFNTILSDAPQLITQDEPNGGWSLAAPDNGARFIWSRNFAASPLFDMMLELDAAPFIAAGLDPARLPDNFSFNSESNLLIVGTKLGTEQLQYKGEVTPLASYVQIVRLKPQAIGYHSAMDHYGVDIGNGNMFEWAHDATANDKDIVFVLNPEPFIAAGTDPDRIEGWIFTKVPVHDEKGRLVQVDKILKPFDILN